MVNFDDLVDGDHRYLLISDDSSGDPTKILTYEPLVKGLAKPWPEFTDYSREGLTERTYFGKGDTIVRYLLKSRDFPISPLGTPSQSLCNRIDTQETSWGDELIMPGEFRYTEGYWEWVEDILARCGETLLHANIFDAVYASLFTYDRTSNVVRAFCESWSPSTNTSVNASGEGIIVHHQGIFGSSYFIK